MVKHLVLVEKVVLAVEVAAVVLLLHLVTELVQVEELQTQYPHHLDGVIMVDKITEMNHIVQVAAVVLAQMVMMVEMPIVSQPPWFQEVNLVEEERVLFTISLVMMSDMLAVEVLDFQKEVLI